MSKPGIRLPFIAICVRCSCGVEPCGAAHGGAVHDTHCQRSFGSGTVHALGEEARCLAVIPSWVEACPSVYGGLRSAL